MAEYNDSGLTLDQWNEVEAKANADPLLTIVWEDFKKFHRGATKRAIKTFDSYLTFADAAIESICGDDVDSLADDKDFLEVGNSSPEAVRSFKVTRFLKDKDDKTAERIAVILKNYGSLLEEREKIFNGLGADDQKEVKQISRHAQLAKANEEKLKA